MANKFAKASNQSENSRNVKPGDMFMQMWLNLQVKANIFFCCTCYITQNISQ